MRIMDRYLFINFLGAYLICFVSLVGLYVTIDLFANADEFMEEHAGVATFARKAGTYYFVHSFEYFNRLSPIITQIAAMTTLASLHRYNEIVALLAAGIPTRRALMPICGGVLTMIGLGVANREYFIPKNAEMLQRQHDDIDAQKTLIPAKFMDRDQILFKASGAHRDKQRLEHVSVTLPEKIVGQLQEVQSPEAFYLLDETTGTMGWKLLSPTPLTLNIPTDKIRLLPDGSLMIHCGVTFADMIRQEKWYEYASLWDLLEHLRTDEAKNPQKLRILIHERLMQPALEFLLVLIGVPFVLQWERKNIYRSIAVSMLLSGLFFVVSSTAGHSAGFGYLDPATAAWIPIFIFGPVAFGLFHRIGT